MCNGRSLGSADLAPATGNQSDCRLLQYNLDRFQELGSADHNK
jgi:hypothetical protein